DEFDAVAAWAVFARGRGNDHSAIAEAGGLVDALVELGHGTDLAAEADLADRGGGGGEAAPEVGAGDGEEERKVGGGFDDADAADGGGEDVAVREAELGVLLQDCDDHGEAVGVEAGTLALGAAEEAG